jgi:hypothetical protein
VFGNHSGLAAQLSGGSDDEATLACAFWFFQKGSLHDAQNDSSKPTRERVKVKEEWRVDMAMLLLGWISRVA